MLKLCGNVSVSKMPSLRIVQLLVATIWMMMPRSSMGLAFLPNAAMNNNKKNPQDMLQQILSSFTSTPKSTSSSSSSKKEDAKMDATIYDLVVIGAGVVGATAAMTAAQDPFGKTSVALIDSPYESGRLLVEAVNDDDDNKDQEPEQDADLSIGAPTGLFSKALRDTSKRIQVSTLRGMGLREDSIWNEIVSSCVNLASSNAQDIVRQLEFCGVHYYRGLARFEGDPHSITMIQNVTKDGGIKQEQKTILRAKKILLATGSSPFLPAGIPFDGKRIFDSDSINTLSYLPKSIAITGSGIIAVEFAKIFRNLGAEVTLIIRDNVPRNALMKIGLDRDVAAMLVADIVRSGIRIERGAQVQDFFVPPIPSSSSNTIRAPIRITLASLDGKSTSGQQHEIFCDAYLAAVGRQPNTHSLNLESVGIETDAYGGILVDSNLCTTSPAKNIYAAGDVVGRPFLASTGVAQAKAALNAMFREEGIALQVQECQEGDDACIVDGYSQAGLSFDPASLASNPFAFPCGVWSSPEAAYYGFTAEQAKDRGMDAGEGIALYAECLRGRVFSPNGLLKVVFEKPTGRIVGVHVVGDDACEIIHYGMELVKGRRTITELSQAMFSAVTFHEMYRIAAQAALDEAGARRRRAAAGKALAKRNREIRDQERV